MTERRVLITGAARGIGAALAERLHERGARVALAGLEPERLAETAARCGDAPWWECDVTERDRVEATVAGAVDALGGLDVVVANAGVAAQLPMIGGDPAVMERTLRVNVLGAYHTLRAAGPHVAHRRGYALAVASPAAAVQVPLLGAYSASKAAVEAMGNTLPSLATSFTRILLVAIPVIILSGQPGFQLRWVWYLSVASVMIQLCLNLLLLRREFRVRLDFGPVTQPAG